MGGVAVVVDPLRGIRQKYQDGLASVAYGETSNVKLGGLVSPLVTGGASLSGRIGPFESLDIDASIDGDYGPHPSHLEEVDILRTSRFLIGGSSFAASLVLS
jgi:hypothetical protein